jgi:hypothetical protein
MSNVFTLQEACMALDIDQATLHRWMAQAQMQPEADPIDKRRRSLTAEQVMHLAALHRRPLPGRERNATHYATQSIDYSSDVLQRIQHLERVVDALGRRIEALEKREKENVPPTAKKAQNRAITTQTPTSGLLPDGYVPLSDFYKLHRVPRTTVRHQVESGALPIKYGQWTSSGHAVNIALDAEGRAAFHALFHAHPKWVPCKTCPHQYTEE